MGNHDQWLSNWFLTAGVPGIWLLQGDDITKGSFKSVVTSAHKQLLEHARLFYIFGNNLFVHGGFMTDSPIDWQDKDILLWDQSLVKNALLIKQLGEEVIIKNLPAMHFHWSGRLANLFVGCIRRLVRTSKS